MAKTTTISALTPNFPQKLKDLRQLRGWSQGQLALKIGVEANRVSKYERGVMLPTLELLVRIADAFGVSIDTLLRDEPLSSSVGLRNPELLKRLELMDELPEDYQQTLISVVEAFIKRYRLEELAKNSVLRMKAS